MEHLPIFILKSFGGYYWGGINLGWTHEIRFSYGFPSPEAALDYVRVSLENGEPYFFRVDGIEPVLLR
jgi:hypothetical protein